MRHGTINIFDTDSACSQVIDRSALREDAASVELVADMRALSCFTQHLMELSVQALKNLFDPPVLYRICILFPPFPDSGECSVALDTLDIFRLNRGAVFHSLFFILQMR